MRRFRNLTFACAGTLAAMLAFFVASRISAQDEVRLTRGDILRGKVVRDEPDRIAFKLENYGVILIQKSSIQSVAINEKLPPMPEATPLPRATPTPKPAALLSTSRIDMGFEGLPRRATMATTQTLTLASAGQTTAPMTAASVAPPTAAVSPADSTQPAAAPAPPGPAPSGAAPGTPEFLQQIVAKLERGDVLDEAESRTLLDLSKKHRTQAAQMTDIERKAVELMLNPPPPK